MALDGMKDRWERLAPRERLLMVLLGLTAVVCVFGYTGWLIQSGLRTIEAKNEASKDALKLIDEHHDDLLEARLLGGSGTGAGAALAEAPPLATYLEGIANEVGVQIPESTERPVTTKGKFHERGLEIKLRNVTIDQLAQFLKRVETRSPAVVVQRLYVKTYFNQHDKLDVEMTVSAFEKAKADKKDKGGDKGDGATPKKGEAGGGG